MAHPAGEEPKKNGEKFLKNPNLFPETKRAVVPSNLIDKSLLCGCKDCPENQGHVAKKAPFAGPKDLPRIRVICGKLEDQEVKPHKGTGPSDCTRLHHVMNKKYSPGYLTKKQPQAA